MNFEEVMKPKDVVEEVGTSDEVEVAAPDELDVQRTVVEALATEKAELDEQLAALRESNERLKGDIAEKQGQIDALKDFIADLKKKGEDTADKVRSADASLQKVAELEKTIEELRGALAKVGEVLARNSEKPESNQVALLDRSVEIDDHFIGETRDHVLEALREARDSAEKDGRLRRAQLLESVLVANEPVGELAKRRGEIEKLFADNGNIVNGAVIARLEELGIAHKDGDTYLLASEIIKRNY